MSRGEYFAICALVFSFGWRAARAGIPGARLRELRRQVREEREAAR